MATRGKRSTKRKSGKASSKQRQAERAASRREGSPRGRRAESAADARIVAASSSRRAASPREGSPRGRRAEGAPSRQIAASRSNLSTLRVVWRPAIAMATLPYRVYRVYRWAEAESHRSSAIGSPASA